MIPPRWLIPSHLGGKEREIMNLPIPGKDKLAFTLPILSVLSFAKFCMFTNPMNEWYVLKTHPFTLKKCLKYQDAHHGVLKLKEKTNSRKISHCPKISHYPSASVHHTWSLQSHTAFPVYQARYPNHILIIKIVFLLYKINFHIV